MVILHQSGYLACNGETKNVAEYEDLAKFLGVDTKTETTFKLPDLQGEFLRGAGTNSHTNQGSGGTVREHQDATKFPRLGTSSTALYSANLSTENHEQINVDSTSIMSGSEKGRNQPWTGEWNTPTDYNEFTSRPTNTSVLYCIKT